MPRRIRMLLEYDGTDFFGFQRQPGCQPERRTVQGVVETALSQCCGHPVTVIAAGRTDTGVHALGQVIHFDTTGRIPVERLPLAVGNSTGPEVTVRVAEETTPQFHARFMATARSYHYYLSPRRPTPLQARYAVHAAALLPDGVARMANALKDTVGRHDFAAFCAAGGDERTTIRTVTRAELSEVGGLIRLELTADGFLRSMVRGLVGLLLQIGRGKQEPGALLSALHGEGPKGQRITAPPQGLILVRVDYPDGFPSGAHPDLVDPGPTAILLQEAEPQGWDGLPPMFAGLDRAAGEESRQ